MNISYEWKITALKKAPSLDELSDVITHVRFDYTGTDADSGESYTFSGACPILPPDPNVFTPLTEVLESDVILWAQANHPTDHMNYIIEKNISDKITPKNEEVSVDEVSWLTSLEEQVDEEETE
jgi:hypothetical protein